MNGPQCPEVGVTPGYAFTCPRCGSQKVQVWKLGMIYKQSFYSVTHFGIGACGFVGPTAVTEPEALRLWNELDRSGRTRYGFGDEGDRST